MYRSLLLAVAATLIALLLGEIGLRLAGQSYYWAFSKRPDPVLGWRPPPDSAAWQRFEGRALVETNALGFRDLDHRLTKPAGSLRIAVLGDSFTEAVQVALQQTWWRRMAAQLNSAGCPGIAPGTAPGDAPRSTEVLSFAVSGYSTAQALLAWRAHARQFSPDVVILALFIGNDLNENVRALDSEPLRPYLVPARDGMRLDDGFLRSPEYRSATRRAGRALQWLREQSRIAQLLIQARDAARMASLAASNPEQHSAPQEPGVDNALYQPPNSPAWEAAWQTMQGILAAFSEETRAAAAEPLLMLIGTGAQVHPDSAGRARFAAALGLEDLGYPVRRLLDIAHAHRIPVLNLPARWTQPSDQPPVFFHGLPGSMPGFGHWNANGHRAAGEAAAELICWLRSRPPPG